MVRNSSEPGGRDLFSCSPDAWALLLEIGLAFGWKAQGASYVPGEFAIATDSPARHGYQPGDVQDSKLINAVDALEWATALSTARDSPHLSAMIGDRSPVAGSHETAMAKELRSAETPFDTIMDEFITYAFGGSFVFFFA